MHLVEGDGQRHGAYGAHGQEEHVYDQSISGDGPGPAGLEEILKVPQTYKLAEDAGFIVEFLKGDGHIRQGHIGEYKSIQHGR